MEEPVLTPEIIDAMPLAVQIVVRWLVDRDQQLRSRVAQLEAEIAELRVRLNQNSSNSSKPPSSDPPSHKPAPKKPSSGKRQGGQPGHPRHARPARQPTQVIDQIPFSCGQCGHLLLGFDPHPICRQVVELPVIEPQVIDYRLHRLTCVCCGAKTQGELPPEAQQEYGPRLQAVLALLSGEFRLSKRSIEALCEGVLGIPISTGQICDLEQQTGQVLETPVAQAQHYVQGQPANVDETGWREGFQKAWLWVAATTHVAIFVIRPSRSRAVFRELMGPLPLQVVTSDRYDVYSHLPPERRQLCWAHLRRDFQAMIDRDNPGKSIGRPVKVGRHDVRPLEAGPGRDAEPGSVPKRDPPGTAKPSRSHSETRFGMRLHKTVGVCMELLRWQISLWRFAFVAGVEPTNNAAERAVRHAVCWRKTSHGTASEAGSRFVERILTVVASCRLQGRRALDYLTDAIRAARTGLPHPSLIPAAAS